MLSPRLLALLLLVLLRVSPAGAGVLHRYWPRFPRPQTLLLVPFVGDHEEGMTFESAAGLAAAALARGQSKLLLYEDVPSSAYQRWYQEMRQVVKPRLEGPVDTWQAVRRLRDLGIVRGYILFRYDTNNRPFHSLGAIDESANVATSLAPVLGGVAVSERLRPRAEALGLPLLLDARDRTEAWCLQTYEADFSRRVVMTADPKSRVARSQGVALHAFVVSQPGPTYEAALARCEPDCPVLGWGCGAEDAFTLPSTQLGLFQTATNWCHNLPGLSTEEVGETIPRQAAALPMRCRRWWRDLAWETGVHYATFIMSDGDNVQWLMGNFAGGSEGRWYYESPARGQFPFGWTCPYVDLAQLCPYALVDLFRRATRADDFVLYGGGYFYPDQFGSRREGDAMQRHARRLAAYMSFAGLRSLAYNLQDWDGPGAQRAYDTLAAEVPTLDGIFTVQYYPYSGGEGRILWARGAGRDVPIVSCRLCLWANTGRPRDTTPAGVAHWLNELPRGGARWSPEHFSFVMAHAWSRFRDTQGDPDLTAEEREVDQDHDTPGTARGLLPVQWTVQRLDPQVRVVTPAELLLLVRLHLRTRETLTAWLADLWARVADGRCARARQLLAQAEGLLPAVRDGDDSGRECFRLLQRADRLTPGARLPVP